MSWKLAARAAGVEKAGAAPQRMTQPNDAKLVCSVSWHSKRSPVHQMPQERRQNARLEARAITACCSWRELRLLEQQSRDTEEGMLSGISQKHNMRSGFCRFTESCNSQCLSHFAAPFIVVRTETSIAESCEFGKGSRGTR